MTCGRGPGCPVRRLRSSARLHSSGPARHPPPLPSARRGLRRDRFNVLWPLRRPSPRCRVPIWVCRWYRARKTRRTASGKQVTRGTAEAIVAFSGVPSWGGGEGPREGFGRKEPSHPPPPGGLQVPGTCGWISGNLSIRDLRAAGPLLQKLRPLPRHPRVGDLLQP